MPVLGARPIGARSFGDGASSTLIFGATITGGAVTFAGTGTFLTTITQQLAVTFAGTATFLVTPAVAIAWTLIRFDGRATFLVTIPPRGKNRRIIAVDQNGTPIGSFGVDAVMGDVTWTLNTPDDFIFALPANNDKAALVHDERLREVQLWRGDQILSWGPMTRPEQVGPNNALTVRGKSVMWNFLRRFIGKADRTNYVVNGSFENGLTAWNFDYAVQEPVANRTGANIAISVDTTRVLSGSRSLRMEISSSVIPEWGFFANQIFVWTVDPTDNPDGDQWTAAVKCYIPSASFVGPGPENIGLRLGRFSTTETVSVTPPGGSPILVPKPIEGRDANLTADVPLDTWLSLSVDLLVPLTGDPEYVVFTLGGVRGVIFYDVAMLARKERLAFFNTDQAQIVQGIGEHLQDAAYDKSDLNIDFDCPPTGVLRDRIYVHSEHPPGGRSMLEFAALEDGMDVGMRFTATTRTLFTRFLGQGNYQPHLTLRLGKNIGSYTWAWDGDAAANSVILLGEGVGSTREEGFAEDTSTYANDTTLERVEVAPIGTPIDSLDARSIETLAVVIDPDIVSVVTHPDSDLIGRLGLGDTVHVDIHEGELVVNNIYRVVQMVLHPNDSLSLTLNKRTMP